MRQALLSLALISSTAQAQDGEHVHDQRTAPAGGAQIIVTINPEARVSAIFAEAMPPPAKCGQAIELKVQINNQGLVTAPLRSSIVGSGKSRVALHMDTEKLSGTAQDARYLHLIPLSTDTTDITVAFSIDNNVGDLGGRDRVHLLVRCL